MVQVDVFWSYALGAGFAWAAHRQIEAAHRVALDPDRPGEEPRSLLENGHFTAAVLYVACLFAPSGLCLLWAFPSWETMHVFPTHASLPAWLVTLFAVTNVTQGVAGFFVTKLLLERNRPYAAFLQTAIGYFLMFFVLVHGWDGSGYRRFFSSSAERFADWKLSNIFQFFYSDVGVTLYILGVFLVPLLLAIMSRWIVSGYDLRAPGDDRSGEPSRGEIVRLVLRLILVESLGLAIVASLLVRLMTLVFGGAAGWLFGLAAFAGVCWWAVFRDGSRFRAIERRLAQRA